MDDCKEREWRLIIYKIRLSYLIIILEQKYKQLGLSRATLELGGWIWYWVVFGLGYGWGWVGVWLGLENPHGECGNLMNLLFLFDA